MSFSYASAGSGPSAGGIGWFNFGNLTLVPGQTILGLTGTLNDGSTVTFDMSAATLSGAPSSFVASPVPTFGGAAFGNAAYTGILGNAAMYATYAFAAGTNELVISNIVVKDSMGNPITNYTAVIADAESTNFPESWIWNTTGGNWALFTTVAGSAPLPTIAGLGTPFVTIAGNSPLGNASDYLLTSQSPTALSFEVVSTNGLGRQAIAIGFAITQVKLQKNIGDRINSADQFVLNIAGVPNGQVTTAGAAVGIQPQMASLFGFSGNTYTINEAMAAGSVSLLSDYTHTVSAVNLTPGGSIPPTGSLPINFTPALGDDVVYTILNSAPEIFTKSVDKTFAKPGDILTYTVTGINPNNYPLPGVVFSDATPAGTVYVGNLIVSVPYTGTDPATGLTLTMPPNSIVTASWQVMVNNTAPISNPIVNIATAQVPGGTSGNTNPVSTRINYADLTSTGNFVKSVDKAYAQFGDILTYTLTLHNTGNMSANNVVLTDIIPAGTTYVPGSLAATAPFIGDPTTVITLANPIPASGSVTVTFKVKLGDGVPPINPVPNTASVNYTYTVDPLSPNSISASGNSNTVNTTVSTANITINKTADKTIGYIDDVITYNLLVKNTGNVSADNVVITDPIPNGTVIVPGSLIVSVPFTGSPNTVISLTNAVVAGQTVTISFKVKVIEIPVPNPIINVATAAYTYTVNPLLPNGVTSNSASNSVSTIIFVNNYSQQISDMIESIALQEAAIAAIANAEGAKLQRFVSMPGVTPEMLLCVNKSITEMTNSLTLLESIFMQKLSIVDCQICGDKSCK